MVGSKVPLSSCTHKYKIKKEKSKFPHTIVPIGTKKSKKKGARVLFMLAMVGLVAPKSTLKKMGN
jgi:hypothetical protein